MEQVSDLLESITESLPRIEVYERLQSENILQVALLNIFTDVVDFSVRALQFFHRGTLGMSQSQPGYHGLRVLSVRLAQSVVRSFDRDMVAIIARLERHAKAADQTAMATELLRAAEFRKETCRRQNEELKLRCENWLKPSDVEHVHLSQVRARLNGTCDWITSNNTFERWVKPEYSTSHDRTLIISGTHGCGKSVLASSIVTRLEKSKQHTLFFAFSSSDGSRQTSENLIRTLLWQLLQEIADQASLDTVYRLSLDGQPTIPGLWKAFERIASSLSKPVYCTIDGIDECIDDDHSMFIAIQKTLEECPMLRILLLARPYVFQAYLGTFSFAAIDITSVMLSQDIEAFINDEIAKSEILSVPECRKNVYETLKDRSDGMFLWVRLMVDDLKKSSSKSELSERLQNLPCGLEKAYQLLFIRLSQKLDKYEIGLVKNILAFTSTSCRPLRFEEFRYAQAMYCRSLEAVAQPLEEYILLWPPQRVLDITEGLVSVTDGVLRLIHSSVRDFLVRPEVQWVSEPDRALLGFRIDIEQTHRLLAWLCLDYIRFEKDERRVLKCSTPQSTQALREDYPFLGYSTSYAFFHLNRSGPPCAITLAKVQTVMESTQSILWIEHFAHLLFEDITLFSQVDEVVAWCDRTADTGLDERFFAIFKETLNDRNDQMRKSGKIVDSLSENLEVYLNRVTDGQSGNLCQKLSSEATDSVLEPYAAGPNLHPNVLTSSTSSNDPSATVSRVIDLLKGQTSLSIGGQIELWLRLSTSLQKTSVMIDPLKVLFRLILRKASGIHVFALMAVGDFYERLEKYQEALEVFSAASRKMDQFDGPIKNRILLQMTRLNYLMCRYAEVETLGNTMCMKQEFVTELNLAENLFLHDMRYLAYMSLGDYGRAAHVKNSLRATLRLCHEKYGSDNEIPSHLYKGIGSAYDTLGEYPVALKYFQLNLEASRKSKKSTLSDILHIQYRIGSIYKHLGRYSEAKTLLEMVYAKQHSLHGPNHLHVRWTKNSLDSLRFGDSEMGEEEAEFGLDEEEGVSELDEGDDEHELDRKTRNKSTGEEEGDAWEEEDDGENLDEGNGVQLDMNIDAGSRVAI